MPVLANIIIALVVLIHLYILWLEMFAWTTRGPKVFRHFPRQLFEPTKALAANQGLYNGFLAAGLIWSFFIKRHIVAGECSILFSSNFHFFSRISVLFFILTSIHEIQAQCDNSGNPPTVQCVDAPLNCLINSCYMTTDEVDQGWPGFCGSNTVIHNPQYFEIIPSEDCIEYIYM